MTNETSTNEQWYAFTAPNRQAHHGYGTASEAAAYCARLNAKLEMGLYSASVVTDPERIAALDDGDEGENMADALATSL